MVQVKNFMIPRNKLVTCDVKTTIHDANGIFLINKIGSIVVTSIVKDFKLQSVGIITKTDVLKAYFTGRDSKGMTVSEFMSKTLFSCHDETELTDIAEQMTVKNVHHMIVLNDNNAIVGMTSSLDLAKEISKEAKDTFPYLYSLFGITKGKNDYITESLLEKLAPFTVDDEYMLYNDVKPE